MTEQKQIEEIKRDIKKALEFDCSKGKCKTCKHKNEDNCEIPLITDYLIEQGYHKVPEGAVVLTKEDLQKYAKDCLIGEVAGYDILQMAFERAKRWRDDARKETAKEIFNALGNILVVGLTTKLKNYPQFKEVCKKYGVEEEE